MIQQVFEVDLAAGDVYDVCPVGAGTLPCIVNFIDELGCVTSLLDGSVCLACNDKGDSVFRVTAAAAMKGWLKVVESADTGPDCVIWPAPAK